MKKLTVQAGTVAFTAALLCSISPAIAQVTDADSEGPHFPPPYIVSQSLEPFSEVASQVLPDAIQRGPGLYDLQPSILYTPENPTRAFQMWWLGRFYDGVEAGGDRIYYAYSQGGTVWSEPQVALEPQFGSGGYDAADDHLIGSPSVLYIDDIYYMFYEGYGNQVTLVSRYFNFAEGDTWTSGGWVKNFNPVPYQGYELEEVLGIAPTFEKIGTHPVYAGEVAYAPEAKRNRFLSCKPLPDEVSGTPITKLYDGQPLFWLYDDPAPGRVPLYSCFDPLHKNSFVSLDPACEVGLPDTTWTCDGSHLLGYIIDRDAKSGDVFTAPDLLHANQNRVCLAVSVDGENWDRYLGDAPGGAMIAPLNPFTNQFPHTCDAVNPEEDDVHRAYGSGFPVSIVRDGMLEVWFTDDTPHPISDCFRPPLSWRIQIPLEDICNPPAYVDAERQFHNGAGTPCDMKWSSLHQRYFAVMFNTGPVPFCSPGFEQGGALWWSHYAPYWEELPLWTVANTFTGIPLPPGKATTCGGLLGDGYGRTVDFPLDPIPHSALHMFFSTFPSTSCDGIFDTDISHVLMFGNQSTEVFADEKLQLVAAPDTLSAGSLALMLTATETGVAAVVIVERVNGIVVSLPLVFGLLGDNGVWTIPLIVPPGLVEGLDVELVGHSAMASGITTSNRALIAIQTITH